MDLNGRSLLTVTDLNDKEFLFLVGQARSLRGDKRRGVTGRRLAGRNVALIFEKTSTRTRSAFEVAAYDEGGHVTYLGPGESQLGHKESVKDTARVLGRMFDGIEYRGFAQESVDVLGAFAGVPVWNGLSDTWHPTQMLADILTITDHCGKPLSEVSFCYLGDGRNNTANSLLVTGATLGMDARICAPAALQPSAGVRGIAAALAAGSGARLTVTDDVSEGVAGVDFLYTDVWLSLGEPEDQWGSRIDQLLPYQVNADVLKATGNPEVNFLHCLPALHNRDTEIGRRIYASRGLDALEVTDEVFESPASVVFDQAENRMHTIKALMIATILLRPRPAADRERGPAMRVVVALGGNALLERGEPPDAVIQRRHVRQAAAALAPLTAGHQLVLCHGNGPQVGVLALESQSDLSLSPPYPLDVLVAQTQGMIGYWLVQELHNAGVAQPAACVMSQAVVDPSDPAFGHPAKFIGAGYGADEARALAARLGWTIAADGPRWRRVVASPRPLGLVEIETIRSLVDAGVLVVCGGGGGVPVARSQTGELVGVEAVVDKDLTAAELAITLKADRLLVLTDVPAVIRGYGTPGARQIRAIDADALSAMTFPAGSMGPKVEACLRFVGASGQPAAIGALTDAAGILAGRAGTTIRKESHE